jgi:hypothetical protein
MEENGFQEGVDFSTLPGKSSGCWPTTAIIRDLIIKKAVWEDIMDNLICIRTDANEYRATVPGTLLIIAQKEPVSLFVEDAPGKIVNISSAPWLIHNNEETKGISGSIQGEKFSADHTYIVYYKPYSKPPYMFAMKQPT